MLTRQKYENNRDASGVRGRGDRGAGIFIRALPFCERHASHFCIITAVVILLFRHYGLHRSSTRPLPLKNLSRDLRIDLAYMLDGALISGRTGSLRDTFRIPRGIFIKFIHSFSRALFIIPISMRLLRMRYECNVAQGFIYVTWKGQSRGR